MYLELTYDTKIIDLKSEEETQTQGYRGHENENLKDRIRTKYLITGTEWTTDLSGKR